MDGTLNCPSADISEIMNKVSKLTIEQNRPNPFSNNTMIEFVLPSEQFTKIEILDIYGNIVKTLESDILSATVHSYYWDGSDAKGKQVGSGTYFARVSTETENSIIKMTLIR